MKKIISLMVVLLVLTGYACKKSISATEKTVVLPNVSYTGTGSVTKGLASTTISSLYSCSGGRVTAVGSITSTDGKVWTVPSDHLFGTSIKLPDLYNECNGKSPTSLAQVDLAKLCKV